MTESELYTLGDWDTEAESVAELDRRLGTLSLFKVYQEVRGYYPQPRLGVREATPRIDRVLMPTSDLYAMGWGLGPVGIECKRSGEKVGRPFSQLLDYSRAIWTLDEARGLHIAIKWYFLWPFGQTYGPLASILAQHRLGSLKPGSHWNGYVLEFFSGGQRIAAFDEAHQLRTGPAANGNKVGSR